MFQDIFDHCTISAGGNGLIFILKIAVIATDVNRNTPADRGIQIFRTDAPSFDGIARKTFS